MGGERTVAMPAFHQDQVIVPPPGTAVVASSPACAYAALRYTYTPILSVQFHPEFSRPYLADLIDVLSKQDAAPGLPPDRSEEHTSELQSLMRISYAVFCLKKKKTKDQHT